MSPMPFVPDRLLASVMSSAHLVSRSSTKKPKTSALTGAIIGVVIACICVALVVIVAVILLLRYRRKRMNISPPRVSFNPFTPTPSGHKGEIKSSAERVSLSSAQYVHFNGHKTNPSVSSSSTDLSAPMLPPVFPVPPAPVAQQPSDRLNGSFHPSVGGFNLTTSTDGAWHARSPSDQSNTSTWSAAATAQRYIASVATPDQTSHPDYPNGRAVDGGPVPVTLLGGASASTGDWVGGSRALVNDLKQRPLPEPPKQNPAAGVSQWI